ncbi:unnamed protein product [Urochloa humidicola]
MPPSHVQPSGCRPLTVRPSSSLVALPSMTTIQAGCLKNSLLVVTSHDDAIDIFSVNVKFVDATSGAIIGQLDGQHTDHSSAAAASSGKYPVPAGAHATPFACPTPVKHY